MKTTLKRLLAMMLAVVAAVMIPASAFAFGPVEGAEGRKYFDYKDTANYPKYPAFNSFKNSPSWGFEPDFMSIKESTSSKWDNDDKIQLKSEKTYDVVVFYHNNAPLNTHTALNTKVKIDFPSVVKGKEDIKGTASVSASNSTPKSVWSTLTFQSETDTLIRYVQDSAFIKYSDNSTKKLPNEGKDLFTKGQLVGKDLDGKVAGCDEHSAMIQFQIIADQADFSIKKEVRINNDDQAKGGWVDNIKAKAGDKLDFLITYKNTGTIQQNDVVIKDKLPKYLSYIKNSAVLYNASNPTSKGGLKVSDNVTGIGVNIGNYAPGANAILKFSAQIADVEALECGTNKIENTGRAETSNGSKEDIAIIITEGKICEEPKPPIKPDLPKSGPETIIGAVIGASSLAVTSTYYIISRKK